LHRTAARTILPHFVQRFDFFASLALVCGRDTIVIAPKLLDAEFWKAANCNSVDAFRQSTPVAENRSASDVPAMCDPGLACGS